MYEEEEESFDTPVSSRRPIGVKAAKNKGKVKIETSLRIPQVACLQALRWKIDQLRNRDYIIEELTENNSDNVDIIGSAHGRLYCMIFAPFTGKDNHWRPVAFGACLLSKENADSFSWLFERFVKCMGSAPKLIITDQDLGMKVDVERVLVDTRHRWCMWHIVFKVMEKLPKNLLGNEDLKKELNNCVWSELIEPEEFDEEWNKVMEKYGLKDNEWLSSMFASRKFWVSAFFRDFPMSSLIKTTSISESQNIFFKRYSKFRSNLVEFLMNYNNALDGQRSNNNRLEYLDFNTIPTLKTNSAIEKHASTIYSDSGFKLIQSEIEEAVDNVTW
ncbi:protein FAR1-RELATED SEQUENCE 5-like [Salvia splendens]|uniref:protein FAR1-RELATED SEQUENCE 5-like n=1 Tax=Salvia splendens TaxID=180675 RepID=UPI001C261BB0|nr:protein FAR1-RELATED SEQUENCE 5-like [Salvia splendens]